MKKTIQVIGLVLISLLTIWNCKRDAITDYTEEVIIADQGGIVITQSGITLEIPEDAFENDGVVFLGKTGTEPTTVPNEDFTVVGESFTIKLPVDTLLNSITLKFPLPSDDFDVNNGFFVLFNGTSYFPYEYEIVDGLVSITIDTINWEEISTRSVMNDLFGITLISEMIIAETIIDENLLGVKEVSIVSGKIVYNKPKSVNSSSKILLFVHGLMGDPTGWEEYVKKIYENKNDYNYTHIWTFGYNSNIAIDAIGAKLKKSLTNELKNTNPVVHIVAHSMGGLVSRSMIEELGRDAMVDKLITLGTPHLGSPMEAFRSLISTFLKGYDKLLLIGNNHIHFNLNTDCVKEMNETSAFITERRLMKEPPIPYYTIACINNGFLTKSIFSGKPHDGLVSVSSAKGASGSVSPSTSVIIPHKLAHFHMRTFTSENPDINSVNEILFKQVKHYLLQEPLKVSTGDITNITTTSAVCIGNVNSEGAKPVTARGMCWNMSGNPTISHNKTTDGTGKGTFTSNITGLSPNTKYYVRAYATNETGTVYGEQKSFTTQAETPPEEGTFIDSRDGTKYKTVIIGDREWMAENLKYLPKVNDPATSSETEACYYVYDYDGINVAEAKSTANYQTYGVLYNWPAAMNGEATSNTIPSGVKGICPEGWHLPSDEEWKQLEMFLGMTRQQANDNSWRGAEEGGKMKHAGTEYWGSPNTGATNSSGFTALPGGYFYDNKFFYKIGDGFWWSSTQNLSDDAWFRVLGNNDNKIFRGNFYKKNGLSVRCIKDYQKEPGSSPDYGTFTDARDQTVYKTITIDGKEWLAENLKYLPKVNGPATSSETEACYYVYGYNGTNVAEAKSTADYRTYGVLYNWSAAMNGAATSNTTPSDVQGVCPSGWHLPSDAEWKQLEMYLGMTRQQADEYGWRGTDEGGKMKHPGTEYWGSPNTGATNSSGFTALPGGYFYDNKFLYMIGDGLWWSSTQNLSDAAWFRVLDYNNNKIDRGYFHKKNGLSVRCVKDYQKEPGSNPDYATFTDARDQTVYKTIIIDGKEWLAENLKYLPKVNGPDTSSETEACYYVYDYYGTNVAEAKSTVSYQICGVLYNWSAAMDGAATSNTIPSGVQGVCPSGWHLPSDAEWKQLVMYLGMSQSEADETGYRGTDEGGKMKHPGTEYWGSPNTGATNSSGFTALPGGGFSANDSKFYDIIALGYWWSSTQIIPNSTWVRSLNFDKSTIGRFSYYKTNGFSVRCIRD